MKQKTFSPDSRWLVSASVDCTVRVWNLVTGSPKPIDWFRVGEPVMSLSFSSEGNYLITTHLGKNAIYVWSNKTYFSNVFLRPISDRPQLVALPHEMRSTDFESDVSDPHGDFELVYETKPLESKDLKDSKTIVARFIKDNSAPEDLPDDAPSSDDNQEDEDDEDQSEEESEGEMTLVEEPPSKKIKEEDQEKVYMAKDETTNVVTFSDVPRSRIKTVLALDVIRQRNKPKQPPKAPKSAPFFLQTVSTLNSTKFVIPKDDRQSDENKGSHIFTLGSLNPTTPFLQKLYDSDCLFSSLCFSFSSSRS